MATERTFAMIKPDAVKRGLAADILARIHKAGFRIVAIKSLSMSKTEAEGFYAVHKSRPFFGELTTFMSSGKAIAHRPRSRRRHRKMARHHGSHRSRQSRARHNPQRTRRQHRRKLHPRLRRRRNRRLRNQLFLRRLRTALSGTGSQACAIQFS